MKKKQTLLKILCVILVFTVAFGLTACGNKEEDTTKVDFNKQEETSNDGGKKVNAKDLKVENIGWQVNNKKLIMQ